MEVKATRASIKDPFYSFTYRTSQFGSELVFNPGDYYVFEYASGERIVLKASREGDTLYTGKIGPHKLSLPRIGSPTMHEVVSVYKQLKTLSL